MKQNKTTNQDTHTVPSKELYFYNKPTDPLVRKGTEFYGNPNYNKAARAEISSVKDNWNTVASKQGVTSKKDELKTKWTDSQFANYEGDHNGQAHKIGTHPAWDDSTKVNAKGHLDKKNTFHK